MRRMFPSRMGAKGTRHVSPTTTRAAKWKQVVSWPRWIRVLVAALLVATAAIGYDAGTASADSTYVPLPGSWNTKKVYLSPASHSPDNIGCDSYAESAGARAIATKVKDYLFARGFAVRVGTGTYTQNVTSSNSWGSHVHIPIHSNATTSDCSSPYNYSLGGSWLMYKPGSTPGSNLSQKIFDQLKASSPGTWDLKNTDEYLSGKQLYELRYTNMPSAYVEAAFHTFRPDVDWLRLTTTVGNKIGAGIDNYFGNPRCPCPTSVDLPETSGMSGETASQVVISADGSIPSGASRSRALESDYLTALAGGDGSVFRQSTAGLLNQVLLSPDGVAIVDLGDLRGQIPNASTAFVSQAMLGELNAIAFANQAVVSIEYRIDGSCSTFWEWLEGQCQRIER
jgi:N-acetylmuramoyl-L-alanine amidase